MSIESVFKGMAIASAIAAGGVIAANYGEDKCSEGPDKLIKVIAIGCIGCVAGGGVGYLVTRPKVYNGIYDITVRILRAIKTDFVISYQNFKIWQTHQEMLEHLEKIEMMMM